MKLFILSVAMIHQSAFASASTNVFDGIKCEYLTSQKLIGQRFPDGKIVDLEKSYGALGLHFCGSGPIEAAYTVNSITVCNVDYLLLFDTRNKKNDLIIKDVISIGPHSTDRPGFDYQTCTKDGKQLDDLYGIFADKSKSKILNAWKVDIKAMKFNPLSSDGLDCSSAETTYFR